MSDSSKKEIRNTIKKLRSNTSSDAIVRSSYQICNQIIAHKFYKTAKTIALYRAVPGEVDLTPLWINACSQDKTCYFPVLKSTQNLFFLPATPDTVFKNNLFGIPEPEIPVDQEISLDALDIMFLPLVAFDIHCTRLGMGGGYYDRTLEHKKPQHLWGVAFEFQKVDFISPEPWDISLNAVITEKTMYVE